MKAFIAAIVVAVALAVGAAYVLDTRVQQTVEVRFTTSGVRL
jgi:capsular polysaccharide biosynthesis protein